MNSSWRLPHGPIFFVVAGFIAAAAALSHSVQAAEPIPFGTNADPIVFCHAVRDTLGHEDFDTLEATIRRARTLEGRFPGGRTELEGVYETLMWGSCPGFMMSAQDDVTLDRAKKLERWLARNSDPTAAAIALAGLWEGYAWIARGSGTADQVTEAQWRIFNERARTAVGYMKSIDPAVDAEAYSVLLDLARDFNLPRPQLDAIFNSARKAFPSYFGYYREYVSLIEPNWFGQPGDIQRFVHSLQQEPGGDVGASAYSRVAERLAYEMRGENVFVETGLDWAEIQRTFAVREKLYGLSNQAWNALCYFAVLTGDRAAAQRAFRNAAPHFTEWPGWPGGETRVFYQQVLPWIMDRGELPEETHRHQRRTGVNP